MVVRKPISEAFGTLLAVGFRAVRVVAGRCRMTLLGVEGSKYMRIIPTLGP